jgi:hypothetical protein
MELHVKGLLSALRQAVNEAILGSHDVNAALAALSRAGRCPSLAVDVSLEDESYEGKGSNDFQFEDQVGRRPVSGKLHLTQSDEGFLRSLGVAVDQAPQLTGDVK